MDAELSLNDYWRTLNKHKWIVVSVFSLTTASTVFYTEMQTPLYGTQAIIKYEYQAPKLFGSDSVTEPDLSVDIETEVNSAQTPDLAQRAADKLAWPVSRVIKAYKVRRLEQSNLIAVSSLGPDPAATAELVNALAQVYVERHLEIRSRQAKKTVADILARQQEVEASLMALEVERQKFLEKHQALGQSSNLATRLIELESSQKELLKKYTPEHPDMIKLAQRLEATKQQLGRLPLQEMESVRINRELKLNEDIYTTLSRRLEEAKIALASVVPMLTLASKAIVPTAPVYPKKTMNYTVGCAFGLFLGFVAAFFLESLDLSLSTIDEIEKTFDMSVLGIIPHFKPGHPWKYLVNRLLRRRRYSMQLFRSALLFQHKTQSPLLEVYHTLRTNIQSQLSDPNKMVLLFTSAGVAEGKTLTAINYCLAAAHSGLKTLLVEADLRRASIYRVFGTPPAAGLLEALGGKAPWQQYVRGTVDFLMGELDLDKLLAFPGIQNFHLIAGRATTPHIVDQLSGPRMAPLINELRSHFDLVVFDCPPALLFVDSMLIGPHCDGVVMVYQSGKMAPGALKRAKDQVLAAKCRVLGVVLNDMKSADMEPRYGYYYDYGHYTA